MVKCPKCGFEQPEDIYCASCGVKMAGFRTRPAPFYQSWMFKVGLLTLAIIALVIYDRQKSPSSANDLSALTQSSPANFKKTVNDYDPAPTTASAQPAKATVPPPPAAATEGTGGSKRYVPTAKSAGRTAMIPAESGTGAAASTAPGIKPILRVTFYQGSRVALQDLHRESQSSSGDASGGVVAQKKLQGLVSSGELRSVGGNRYRDYDAQNPVVIFKGQRGDTGKNVGLYFQITPLRQDSATSQLEIKSWGNVKIQEGDENIFTTEMTLNSQSSAFISGFLPRDKTFSDEEKTIFESDNTLKIYNQDDFWDNSTDLIMVVELSSSP